MKKNYFIFKELFEKPITESIYIELVLFIWYFIPSTNGFIIIARVFINNEFPSLKNIIEKKKYIIFYKVQMNFSWTKAS